MIDKLLEQVSKEIKLDHEFQPDSLTLKTTTTIGSKVVHTHLFDLTPMFEEFKKRLAE